MTQRQGTSNDTAQRKDALELEHTCTWQPVGVLYQPSVEQTFSTMKRVKTSLRNRLKAVTLNNLLMISIEGPDAEEFDFDSACDKWASMCKRSVSINFRE
ncbi:hypothetical protein Bbelb_243320 [Branchiostoma belcheri]|nr:hypothetical protein Bbelb_243320 [Branchiostoma belcheri]